MIEIVSLLLDLVIIAYAAVVFRSTMHFMARLRRERRDGCRKAVRGEIRALIATVFTMVTLIILSGVTVLYLMFQITPADAIIAIGLNIPISTNRSMLLISTGLQAMLKLYAMDRLVGSLERLHFRSGQTHEEATL